MRLPAEWFTQVDDRILEYLQEHKSGSPTQMAKHENIHFTRSYVHKRCKILADYGLIEDYGNGVYIITDEGEAYLAGELNLNELEPDDEN
ncbi:hypothetical protein SAMN05216388_100216 [Halorientalis persicus]|uniref:Winged helix-turn-helix n=2 Tax=Halorientalis persicus TaxID=1367881 RepID=A0A1H8EI00_9EURY|nr:hypothetical protein SAMN05216388_100216 [Halorientalis persicus]